MRNLLNIIFALLLTNSLFGQVYNKVFFDSLIVEHSYPINIENESLDGIGAKLIFQEAMKAQYFLIGERHGTVEIPYFTKALYSHLATINYDHMAFEFGKIASLKLQELLRTGGEESLRSFIKKDSKSIAFLDWKEEVELVSHVANISKKNSAAIWGLDHEFIFGFNMYLDMLFALATNNDQTGQLNAIRASLAENKFLLGSEIEDQLDELTIVFEKNSAAVEIIDAISAASFIYSRFRGAITRVESNAYRENLMKINLMSFLNDLNNDSSKVLFKFGGYHSAPYVDEGKSTLGTFVEEMAIGQSKIAFNLYCDVLGGTIRSSGQDSSTGTEGTILAASWLGDVDESDNPHLFKNHVQNLTGMLLIDLRPLRSLIDEWGFLNNKSRRLINSFDAYLAIPRATPATPFE